MWLGAVLASAAFGLLGVALGGLTRNTVAAVLGGIGWAMIVENGILQNVAPEIGRWLHTGPGWPSPAWAAWAPPSCPLESPPSSLSAGPP